MTQPNIKEVIEALRTGADYWQHRNELANRIEAEGIAPPDGHIIVPTCAVRKKPYVPMTAEQVGMLTVFDGLHNVETPILAEYIRNIETAVIKRLGLEIKHETEQ